jgi:hypothetical protein
MTNKKAPARKPPAAAISVRVGGEVKDSLVVAAETVNDAAPSARSAGSGAGIEVEGDVAASRLIAARHVQQLPLTAQPAQPPAPAPAEAPETIRGGAPRIPSAPAHAPVQAPAGGKALRAMYRSMLAVEDAQRRGYLLQDLLIALFQAHDIPIVKSFTRNGGGEQVDGAFTFEGWHYLVECRWREKLADIRQLDGLKGQVDRSGRQTLGVYLAMNGWSDNVVALLKQNPDKSILLMNGDDLAAVVEGGADLKAFLRAKLTSLNLEAEPYRGWDTPNPKRKGRQ